ncbi:hypothetical protein EDD85DRAFT_507632 [Armillaria nabsnona]|nr:hypothetical protein EDD85DRAFT_507632 [Armillaria nabsnona]
MIQPDTLSLHNSHFGSRSIEIVFPRIFLVASHLYIGICYSIAHCCVVKMIVDLPAVAVLILCVNELLKGDAIYILGGMICSGCGDPYTILLLSHTFVQMSLSFGGLNSILPLLFREGFDLAQFCDGNLNTAIELALLHGAGVQNHWCSTRLIVVNAS